MKSDFWSAGNFQENAYVKSVMVFNRCFDIAIESDCQQWPSASHITLSPILPFVPHVLGIPFDLMMDQRVEP